MSRDAGKQHYFQKGHLTVKSWKLIELLAECTWQADLSLIQHNVFGVVL